MSGAADGGDDIAEDGQAHADGFAEVWAFPPGMPGHDPLRRVWSRVAPAQLTQCFLSGPTALSARSGGAIGALDGKTRRQAVARAAAPAATHLVSAWANSHRLVLGQGKGEDKANDIPAMPQLGQMLDCTGAPVTREAMGCPKESAQGSTAQGADYICARTTTPSPLYEEVTRLLDDAWATAFAAPDQAYHDPVEGDQGRLEIRQDWLPAAIDG